MDWKEELAKRLEEKRKEDKDIPDGFVFPKSYTDLYSVNQAILDLSYVKKLKRSHPLESYLYQIKNEKANKLHLRLYQWGHHTPLSDSLPIIENLGLRTDYVSTFQIAHGNNGTGQKVWISDFSLFADKEEMAVQKLSELIHAALSAISLGKTENDGFNKLITCGLLSWREVFLIRAYVKYLIQVRFRYSLQEIETTVLNNNSIINDLVLLFKKRHDPELAYKSVNTQQLEEKILSQLDAIASLDEDKILRRLFELIKATVRTNYFKKGENKRYKSYLALKLSSRLIPELPLPMPLYEIFIYSPRFEGIHLRYTKVARGGIRWSDRLGDFRTEILDLMKAQVVKNAVIVPSGAKGGFVLKKSPAPQDREMVKKEVTICYELFISGLLDLTDNIINNKVVAPEAVVCLDDSDPYLVVAADKGTATFSDTANALSRIYHFWLGDAFATGGSDGYDHKKIGITARGTWESIKRHFRELELNVMVTPFTMVGIGDMSGDVFGNGTLYTDKIKLIAAFDHRHIFIDPDPNAEIAYKERQRLFHLPISTWEDYDKGLISKGGGVFSRNVKSIAITPAMKRVLSIDEDNLMPNALIRAILKAPVDLLYNGGIGTYVKATDESHADVGDKANDFCRINGNEVRARIVGEGGNLGFTQSGRIEYALNGGLIFADFIDNSGGVDCSDHEVNLKILVDKEVSKGFLTVEERNVLIATLTHEVADLVLRDNYNQALTLSFSAASAKSALILHTEYIKELESKGIINRQLDHMPDEKALSERKSLGVGLTRPELATLLAYTKIDLKQNILKTSIPEDPLLYPIRSSAFPTYIHEKYRDAIQNHPLMRDITATQLANKIVNKMGITFIYRLHIESGASIEEIIRAYLVSIQVFETDKLKDLIESLDTSISVQEQYDMLTNIRKLLNLSTRWFLQQQILDKEMQNIVDHYSVRIKSLEPWIPELMGGATKQYLHTLMEKFSLAGLPHEIAQRIATYRAIYTALNIIKVASAYEFGLIITAKVYFSVGERFRLLWFRDKIARDTQEGHWSTLARLNLRDELDIAQRKITVAIMQSNPDEPHAEVLLDAWLTKNHTILNRWNKLLEILHGQTTIDYTMIFIALRELARLIPGPD